MRLIRERCAQKIRHALGLLRGPSRDFADKKAVLRVPPCSSVEKKQFSAVPRIG